jgi:hypothetical protein
MKRPWAICRSRPASRRLAASRWGDLALVFADQVRFDLLDSLGASEGSTLQNQFPQADYAGVRVDFQE